MRASLALFALSLLASACGGGAEPAPTPTLAATAPTSSVTEVPPATEASPTTEVPVPTEPATALGPPAPDFTLALSNGDSFVLSAQEKPVYMVFWAEW
ncbi:MAG: hypothetical protein ACE5MI_09415 [Acidimicrobiia bacterium]